MNILSYRGPKAGGGVSAALSSVMKTFANCSGGLVHWWHVAGCSVRDALDRHARDAEALVDIPAGVIEGHYRYCNEFLWPIMHDLPQYAVFNTIDRHCYRRFNLSFASPVLHSLRSHQSSHYFVQDYQMALVPRMLRVQPGLDISLFWHIPWPRLVLEEHRPMLVEVAEGLLGSQRLGFHTSEYADNFLSFVASYMPAFSVDFEALTVTPSSARAGGDLFGGRSQSVTQLVVSPLGLDLDFWKSKAGAGVWSVSSPSVELAKSRPFVLSVDRADYTKGVLERINAIEKFFEAYPERIEQVSFLQVCQPTRQGLAAFDNYFRQCREVTDYVNSRYSQGDWQPIVWVDEPLPQSALIELYRSASGMLVNPVRDGLNLTAKEFVGSSASNPGVLLLSPGAGVFAELGGYCSPVDPSSPTQMACAIEGALNMSLPERQERIARMKDMLRAHTLEDWWTTFAVSPADTLIDMTCSEDVREAIGF